MTKPMEHHRTAHHRQILREITMGLQYVFQTTSDVAVLTGSGTAAMEAAIVNTCDPNGKALVTCHGKFSERWAKVCDTFGFDHAPLNLAWGTGAHGDAIGEALNADPSINTVIITHSETTTAAASDLEGIARITRERDCLLVVDGITSVGAVPVRMDDWGVDVVVTGSQKALMTPPGLGMVAAGPRAWQRIEANRPPALYGNLAAYRASLKDMDSPFTPAITLMMGLRKALQMIRDEGIENVWQRTARLARATRAAVEAMGLGVYAKDPVDSLTAVTFPDGIDVPAFQKKLRAGHGIHVAGGQGPLKGRIIRLNHMGYVDEVDTLGAIGAMELTLADMGHPVEPGIAARAALEVWASQSRPVG